jgi:hypothetical protein
MAVALLILSGCLSVSAASTVTTFLTVFAGRLWLVEHPANDCSARLKRSQFLLKKRLVEGPGIAEFVADVPSQRLRHVKGYLSRVLIGGSSIFAAGDCRPPCRALRQRRESPPRAITISILSDVVLNSDEYFYGEKC